MVYHALVPLNLRVVIAFGLSPYLLLSLTDLRRADCPAASGSGIKPYWPFWPAHVSHISCTGSALLFPAGIVKRTKSKLRNVNVETVLTIKLSLVALATFTPQILVLIATDHMILANSVGGRLARVSRWLLRLCRFGVCSDS
ncbi:hypothetical protein BD410DRAFT_797571 [Rickenella mellea]|uniref:Uncharacterized protein n=1 Tax=Rickenella mellea TaxID=50990 RepID=A0A4Y7PE84_9AGAM|nr:hypothetical protein BD410DRAFT_797571 [Rickenella mellea]